MINLWIVNQNKYFWQFLESNMDKFGTIFEKSTSIINDRDISKMYHFEDSDDSKTTRDEFAQKASSQIPIKSSVTVRTKRATRQNCKVIQINKNDSTKLKQSQLIKIKEDFNEMRRKVLGSAKRMLRSRSGSIRQVSSKDCLLISFQYKDEVLQKINKETQITQSQRAKIPILLNPQQAITLIKRKQKELAKRMVISLIQE